MLGAIASYRGTPVTAEVGPRADDRRKGPPTFAPSVYGGVTVTSIEMLPWISKLIAEDYK